MSVIYTTNICTANSTNTCTVSKTNEIRRELHRQRSTAYIFKVHIPPNCREVVQSSKRPNCNSIAAPIPIAALRDHYAA